MSDRVRIKPVTSYEIITESGRIVGTFKKDSEWNGIVKFKSRDGSMIVNLQAGTIMERILSDSQHTLHGDLIKASPDLWEHIIDKESAEEVKCQVCFKHAARYQGVDGVYICGDCYAEHGGVNDET